MRYLNLNMWSSGDFKELMLETLHATKVALRSEPGKNFAPEEVGRIFADILRAQLPDREV